VSKTTRKILKKGGIFMENASKALIVAGAVLTSILVVATGVQVYNSTGKGASEQAKQASEQMWEGVDTSVGLGEANEPQEEMITFKLEGETADGVEMIECTVAKGTTWREYLGDGACYDGYVWRDIETQPGIISGPNGNVSPDEEIIAGANYYVWVEPE